MPAAGESRRLGIFIVKSIQAVAVLAVVAVVAIVAGVVLLVGPGWGLIVGGGFGLGAAFLMYDPSAGKRR